MEDRQARGAAAEALVVADLLGRGFDVFTPAHGSPTCDIVARLPDQRLVTVEVKLARRHTTSGGWNFSRASGASGRSGRQSLKDKSFDVLAMVIPGTPPLIRYQRSVPPSERRVGKAWPAWEWSS